MTATPHFPVPPSIEGIVELLSKTEQAISIDKSVNGSFSVYSGTILQFTAATEQEAYSFLAGCFLATFGGSSLQHIAQELMPVEQRQELKKKVFRLAGYVLLTRQLLAGETLKDKSLIPGRAVIAKLLVVDGLNDGENKNLLDDVTYVIHRLLEAPPALNLEAYRDLVGHHLSKSDRDEVVQWLRENVVIPVNGLV